MQGVFFEELRMEGGRDSEGPASHTRIFLDLVPPPPGFASLFSRELFCGLHVMLNGLRTLNLVSPSTLNIIVEPTLNIGVPCR